MTKFFELIGMIVVYTIGILGTISLVIVVWGLWIGWIWRSAKSKFNCNINDFIDWLKVQERNKGIGK